MELQNNGLLEAGLHTVTIDNAKETFVTQFITSQKRSEIFDSLLQFMQIITSNYRIYEVWIDGSFVTSKINPNDVDIVIFVEAEDVIPISKVWGHLRNVPNIDAYIAVAVNDESKGTLSEDEYWQAINQRNYWRGQFGFDRADNPKGILVISGEEWKRIYNSIQKGV